MPMSWMLRVPMSVLLSHAGAPESAGEDGHRAPCCSFSAAELRSEGRELCLPHRFRRGQARGQAPVNVAKNLPCVGITDRGQRADDVAGTGGNEAAADAEGLHVRPA